ncbi:ABC transporter ATP-binding protein [Eggerthella sp. YY7918]|uniref:ABC transporter ATP-binding protein n=1 Tax=Eggerthella sp. (strain YY7918) TaxID=502558 RepID=UPI00021715C9|nr:ABC transporter ATP-binding protein [Eggerthella sp. YY7918]BAK45947.1 ABC-type multidrug transport system, ATPase component [Eggerthella sp. YY7918]
MELAIDRLTRQFDAKIAVDRVSATFVPGVYGLLGANGAGKTTLMRMLCDVLRPTSGHILLDGRDICSLGSDYRAQLGYLPQDFGYYPEFTALDFMEYMASLKGISRSSARRRSLELLDAVSLIGEARRKIKTFSGGMKQRLGIAQAMLNEPKILVLDEPTAGLDPKERVRFRNLIASFAQDKIVVLSTHIVSDVEHIADHIIVMRAGAFIMEGKPESIVHSMEGRVWECVAAEREAADLEERFTVANAHYTADGRTALRIIADERPTLNAAPLAPTLEDVYLYMFRDGQ